MIKEAQVEMHMEQLKKKELRLSSALVRFDNVPREISSNLLERIAVAEREYILVYEYVFRRNMRTDVFLRRFALDCRGVLGEELSRLGRAGIKPVLKIDYSSRQLDYLSVTIGRASILKLAKQGRAFRLSFPSQSGGIDWIMTIHREMFALLADYSFSLEI